MFHRSSPKCWILFLVILICFGAALSAGAQSTTQGAIVGTVFDPTGAVVPNATVTIRNDATNAEITRTADRNGYYIAPLLQPGTYTVSVSGIGFALYVASNVIVQVGQSHELDPRLAVKSVGTSVHVTEQAPVLNFQSPDFSDVLNQKAINDIPINNRRWSSLAMTTPGVVSDSNGYGLVSVRGISPLLNNVEIDGADDN